MGQTVDPYVQLKSLDPKQTAQRLNPAPMDACVRSKSKEPESVKK